MQQTPQQLQHKRVNIAGVVQQLLRGNQEIPMGPGAAQQEMDSSELGLDVKQGKDKSAFGIIAGLAKRAARNP